MIPEAKRSVLIVDDDQLIRNLLYALFSDSDYDVDMAENGKAGFQKIQKKRYDLIVSDVNMPEMNGMAFYLMVRENFPGLEKRFIFLTSSQTKEVMSFFSDHDCKYLTKPFKPFDLLDKVEAFLNVPSKKREERLEWSIYCQLWADGLSEPASVVFMAKTLDISHHGTKIRYFGKPLSPGKKAHIYLKDLDLKRDVTVMWSRSLNESVVSGLYSTDDIPTTFGEKEVKAQPHTSS